MVPAMPALALLSTRSPKLSPLCAEGAQRGYARCLMGLAHSGEELLSGALFALEASPDSPAKGESFLLGALAARIASRHELFSDRIRRALAAFGHEHVGRRTFAELLRIENLLSLGRSQEADEAWTRAAAILPGGASLLLQATLLGARGSFEESAPLWERALAALPPGMDDGWARLLAAENSADEGKTAAALAQYENLVPLLPFGESFLRGLSGWALVLARRCEEPQGGDRERAARLVKSALGYSVNVPRYRAWAELARAILGTRSDADAAARQAQGSLKRLGELSFRLDEARLSVWYADAVGQVERRRRVPFTARGRELFSRIGFRERVARASDDSGGALERGSMYFSGSFSIGASLSRSLSFSDRGNREDGELATLFEVNRYFSSSLHLEGVLQRVLEAVVELLKAERGAVLVSQPDGQLHCVAARGVDPSRVRPEGDEISFSVVHAAAASGEAVLTENAQVDDRFRAQVSVHAARVRSALCAPLRTLRKCHGFLYVDSQAVTRAFRPYHRELLGVFATQAAVSLENAESFEAVERANRELEERVEDRTRSLVAANERLAASLEELKSTRLRLTEAERDALQRELTVARHIQKSLSPEEGAHALPGLVLAGRMVPAFYCGGDFWTFFPLTAGRTLLFLGDVTGHGVGAGLIAASAKAAGDTFLRLGEPGDLPGFMAALSDAVLAAGKGERLMTAVACLVDPPRRALHLASAAHESAVLLERAGGLPKLSVQGMRGDPLGQGKNPSFAFRDVSFAPGDRLFLYTDGLTAQTNSNGSPWGNRRMARALLEAAALPVDRLVDRVFESGRAHAAGHDHDDDITLACAELA